jgi:hypothetical protein
MLVFSWCQVQQVKIRGLHPTPCIGKRHQPLYFLILGSYLAAQQESTSDRAGRSPGADTTLVTLSPAQKMNDAIWYSWVTLRNNARVHDVNTSGGAQPYCTHQLSF